MGRFLTLVMISLGFSTSQAAEIVETPIFCYTGGKRDIIDAFVSIVRMSDGSFSFRLYGGPVQVVATGHSTIYQVTASTISGRSTYRLEVENDADSSGLHASTMYYGGTPQPAGCALYPGERYVIASAEAEGVDAVDQAALEADAKALCGGAVSAPVGPLRTRFHPWSATSAYTHSRAYRCGR